VSSDTFELEREMDGPVLINTDVRKTPRWLIEELSLEWDFGLDVCATSDNRIIVNYLGPDHPDPLRRDGLTADWAFYLGHAPRKVAWMNPPYSTGQIQRWCEKAEWEAAGNGVTTVALLPGDTSTRVFHEFVLPNRHHFTKRRLRFEGAPLDSKGRLASAKFGSVIVVFRPERSWSR
jgi:phage N-6-adenine-methyltransferase